MRRTLARAAVVAASLILPVALPAQTATVFTRPWLDWRTLRTEHFEVHYPAEMAEWTLDLSTRLEAAHSRVAEAVGGLPDRRIRIIVEDPAGSANGSAFAFLDRPTISLWPTPPDPRSNIGHTRSPTEQVLVHELAHIAHLSRPSPNPVERLVTGLLPVQVGPIDRRAPRWITEGYATWVEGRLTGSGRPHGVLRAALLRQRALEGKLPSYRSMSRAGGFYGPAMAYMAGSAYIEWLAARQGEASLSALWEGMRRGSFEAAFRDVYGDTPESLYGTFVQEVTVQAVAVRRRIREAGGVIEGDTVHRLEWATGDPALSADGSGLAMVVRGPSGAAGRVVVWGAGEEPWSDVRATRRGHASPASPGRGRALAELPPVEGRAHDAPRFLAGGGLLVVRSEPLAGGASRGDLFVWQPARGELRRVTHGAGIRSADPAPDGRSAAAVRCEAGICSVVRVELETGAVTTLARGAPDLVYHRPRWSPAGDRLAVAVQRAGRWRPALLDPASGRLTEVGPDDGADRYDAAWLPDGHRLVMTSERGGIANLEVLDLRSGAARQLTRVTGAAVAAEVDPGTGAVLFLSLHAGGLDLHRIHPDSAAPADVALSPGMAPAVPLPAGPVDTLSRLPVAPATAYGIGPRFTRTLPQAVGGAQGLSAGWIVSNTDPIGRLGVLLRGAAGSAGMPRGVWASALWRGRPRPVRMDAWWSAMPGGAHYAGGAVSSRMPGRAHGFAHTMEAGVSAGWLDGAERGLGWLDGSFQGAQLTAAGRLDASLRLRGAAGSTAGDAWALASVGAGGGLRRGPFSLRVDATHLRVSSRSPAVELPSAGGTYDPVVAAALRPGHTPMPALPAGAVVGEVLTTWRLAGGFRGISPYLWGAAADAAKARVAGIEWNLTLPPSNVLALPGMDFSAGVGVPLTGDDRRPQLYFGVGYRL